jgi:hypothetical protein
MGKTQGFCNVTACGALNFCEVLGVFYSCAIGTPSANMTCYYLRRYSQEVIYTTLSRFPISPPYDLHILFDPLRSSGWQTICNRRRRSASCKRLATDTVQQFPLQRNTDPHRTVGKNVKYQFRL